jgi:hypothetical protein
VQRRVQVQVGANLDRDLQQVPHLLAVSNQLLKLLMHPAQIVGPAQPGSRFSLVVAHLELR